MIPVTRLECLEGKRRNQAPPLSLSASSHTPDARKVDGFIQDQLLSSDWRATTTSMLCRQSVQPLPIVQQRLRMKCTRKIMGKYVADGWSAVLVYKIHGSITFTS